MKITLFSARGYDRESFEPVSRDHGHEIAYREELLTAESTDLAKGSGGVCVSVNDQVDAAVIEALKSGGCGVLVTRSMGFNHIDLAAAERLLAGMVQTETLPTAVEWLVGPDWDDEAALVDVAPGDAGRPRAPVR